MDSRKLEEILKFVAPGTALRDALNNILEAGLGALIVVGFDDVVKKLTDGGFYLECEFSPERLYELAKMDGAIILDEQCKKILYANIHLQPDRRFSSTESGTRHRTAERTAQQTGKLVIAVSERRNIVTLYKDDLKYRLKETVAIESEASQAIKTMERYKFVLDRALGNLTILELDDTVTMYEVATTLQKFEMLRRIGAEISSYILELGIEGRLLNLQFQNLNQDVEEDEQNLIKDYASDNTEYKDVKQQISLLNDEELLGIENFSTALGYGKSYSNLDREMSPRGYRLLGRISKLTKKDIEKLVKTYNGIAKLQEVPDEEFSEMKISKTKIKALRNGLKRLKLTVELEKVY